MQRLGGSEADVQRVLDTLSSGKRVAILFSGPGCRACGDVKRELRPDYLGPSGTVFEASVDENQDLAEAYRVSQTPTLVILSPTAEIARVTSAKPADLNAALQSASRAR